MKYSLANYILSVDANDPSVKANFDTISIGGEGNYLGSISLNITNPLWTTTGFNTGAWIHNKNLDRHGTVSITLSQLSDQVAKFIRLCKLYYSNDYEGFTLSLSDTSGNVIATCVDCYIVTIPTQSFENEAGTQTWEFTCGQINYN